MTGAILSGLMASGALVLGAVIGVRLRLPGLAIGMTLAFGSGALMSAATLELLQPALDVSDGWLQPAVWFVLGAVIFAAVDSALDRWADPFGPSIGHGRVYGYALLAAVMLDGIPENVALGLTGAEGTGLLVGIALSNFPEALVAARTATEAGMEKRRIILIWSLAAAGLLAAVVAGSLLQSTESTSPGPWLAFASGAVVAALADTLLPQAFERSGSWNAPAAAAGFLIGAVTAL